MGDIIPLIPLIPLIPSSVIPASWLNSVFCFSKVLVTTMAPLKELFLVH